ncbi:hypothetical protein [Nitratifractor sp.]
MNRFFRKLLLPIQYLLVFLFIVFEELVWEGIAKPVGEYLRSLRVLQRLERLIAGLNRYLILVLFVLLFVGVELAGVTAGILLVQGMEGAAVLLYGLKIPIAAFTFWLFGVSREKLLSFGWFRWAYERLNAFLDWLKSREIYRRSMEVLQRIKGELTKFWRRIKGWFPEEEGGFFRRLRALYRRIRAALRRNRL